MCDYSLAMLPNRLAVAGAELVVHRFLTGSKGLAPPADVRIAQHEPASRMSFWDWLKVQLRHGCQVLSQDLPEDMPVQVLSLGGVDVDDHQDVAARPFEPAGHFVSSS
jgi:hypothetical protein